MIFPAHDVLSERLRKSCYYGKLPPTDRPSLALTQLAVEQFSMVGLHKLSRLDVARAAEMSREACASPTSLVFALIYLDRLRRNSPDFLQNISSADLFLVSMMVASKFLYDDGEEDEVFNDEWAKSGQMDVKDFNRLEVEFLAAIDWKVNVSTTDFDSALERIEKEIAYREVSRRDWATYSDLEILSRSEGVIGLWKFLADTAVRVTTVCMAAYAASLFTLLGSTALLNQTPFGPNGLANSYRSLTNRRDSTELSIDSVPELFSPTQSENASSTDLSELLTLKNGKLVPRSDVNVSPAELLTASLLVASIKSGDKQFSPDTLWMLDDGEREGGGSWGNETNITQEVSSEHLVTVPDWLLDKTSFIHHATDSIRLTADESPPDITEKSNLLVGIFDKIFGSPATHMPSRPSARDMNGSVGGMTDHYYGHQRPMDHQRVPDLHSAPHSQWLLPDIEDEEYNELEKQVRDLSLDWTNSVWKNLKTTPQLMKKRQHDHRYQPRQRQEERPAQCPLRQLISGGFYQQPHPSFMDVMAISVL